MNMEIKKDIKITNDDKARVENIYKIEIYKAATMKIRFSPTIIRLLAD